ncbi:unnamed protein product, partial [Iphiclides podalirius]
MFSNSIHRIFLAGLVLQCVLCESRIHLFVYAAPTKKEVLINYYGVDEKVVTALEEKLFNITDSNLRKGVLIELGKEPDDIFLKDPTKYGDLHYKYNWMPVKRSLRVKSAEVVDVISDKVVVKSIEHINNSTRTIKSRAIISEMVESTISSFWSVDGLPEDEVYFDIDYSFNGRAVKYHNRWRHDNFQSASLPFGVTKNGYIIINPSQRVVSRLKGTKTILLIKIRYAASLVGNIVLNYAHVYGKYHFWAPKVSDIMKAAGLTNEIVTTELIEVRCYTNPELEIFDGVTKETVTVVTPPTPFKVRPKSRHSVRRKFQIH